MRCALCGHVFDASGQSCKPSCPMSGGCDVACCPRCGYSFPREEKGLAGVLKKALVRLRSRP